MALYDLNYDGIPELILNQFADTKQASVYTFKDNKVVEIGKMSAKGGYYIVPESKGIYSIGGLGTGIGGSGYYEMIDGGLVYGKGLVRKKQSRRKIGMMIPSSILNKIR